MRITPALARRLLDRYTQTRRRPLSRGHVAQLAHRILHPDPEDGGILGPLSGGVCVARTGEVFRGQHELATIIAADRTQVMVVKLNDEPTWIEPESGT